MALVALDGTPLVIIGSAGKEGGTVLPTPVSGTTMDAANEAVICICQIFTSDGASHTINTTGSSSMGWRSGSSTFANAGTTVKVGLATVDTTTGPPGRAGNVANVITFDVSKTMVGGGGGITSDAWQEHVPDAGTKTIANGDLVAFCVQMTARGGADSVISNMGAASSAASVLPEVTQFTGGSYAVAGQLPNFTITFSDGAFGFCYGGTVFTTPSTTQTWNNTSGTKEYGNYFLLPVPVQIYGLVGGFVISGDADVVLYSDPLGTPVAQKTFSFDLNWVGSGASAGFTTALFATPYTTTANQPVAGILKPTTATSVSATYLTLPNSSYQKMFNLGSNAYAINRNSGAFAAQNSNKDRFGIGLLVGAFDSGVGGGVSRARAASGF